MDPAAGAREWRNGYGAERRIRGNTDVTDLRDHRVLLSERIKDEFTEGDRHRGDHYFQRDRARIIDQTPVYTAALVDSSDGDSYFVQVSVANTSEGVVSATCECPRFSQGFPCKHIWATIRCIDEISCPPGEDRLRLQEEDTDSLSAEFAGGDPDDEEKKPRWPALSDPGALSGDWKQKLKRVFQQASPPAANGLRDSSEADQQVWYVISVSDQQAGTPLRLDTYLSSQRRDGTFGKPVKRLFSRYDIVNLNNPTDRRILSLISNSGEDNRFRYYSNPPDFCITADLASVVTPLICQTGRLVWTLSAGRALEDGQEVGWGDGAPWQLALSLDTEDAGEDGARLLRLEASLTREGESLPLSDVIVAAAGLVLTKSHLFPLNVDHEELVTTFARTGAVTIPESEFDDFMRQLGNVPHCPQIQFAPTLVSQTVVGEPRGLLEITLDQHQSRRLLANLQWLYGPHAIDPTATQEFFWDAKQRSMVWRDSEKEEALVRQLLSFPLRFSDAYYHSPSQLTFPSADLDRVVLGLSELGWEVRAFGRKMRRPGAFDIKVTSNSDWFDLNGTLTFDGQTVGIPQLLKAVRRKESHILLDDGSKGILPQEWLDQYGRFAQLAAEEDGDTLRFSKSQALLLDVMLAEQDNVSFDVDFRRIIEKLETFDGVKPVQEPQTFHGDLRDYQREGLGWMHFLREFGFGGCLADDMGLGKTVQVLALLETRRQEVDTHNARPSLVVVPKSLVFNWMEEAARFTPDLRMLNYTGIHRNELRDAFDHHDVIVTTYGTLRRDIDFFAEHEFDYAILDESQAIKNSKSQASKACRLIRARQRLAMTGTPIENHLGELWTLLDFLNPGMLGTESNFRAVAQGNSKEAALWLAKALRPYLLRRTKNQVLTELPEKTEQTLYCDMETQQRKLYTELRDYYRSHIGDKVNELGVKRAKIHVLEALLRLRQAACDPRLLDNKRSKPGAKLELLIDQLSEIIAEGHKALVFSQFTSLLALVREAVEEKKWTYEYLDGKTRKRQERVERFQDDESCSLFLISLKAGGQGLNLTAADYVYILDPWWNPAVEAQAIDRAHRMGQVRPVNAYRIICRDTVEEKIVELKKSKRELADAIISADKSLISDLTLDELTMLFS